MLYKKIILCAVAAFGIMVFFKTDYYALWLERYITNPDYNEQMKHASVEERRQWRYGNTYIICQYIKKTLDTTSYKPGGEPIVLLPPNDYLAAHNITAYKLAEPAEIYYHIGVVTLWTTSPDVNKANWALIAKNNADIAMVPIRSKEQLQQLLDMYKNYKPAL